MPITRGHRLVSTIVAALMLPGCAKNDGITIGSHPAIGFTAGRDLIRHFIVRRIRIVHDFRLHAVETAHQIVPYQRLFTVHMQCIQMRNMEEWFLIYHRIDIPRIAGVQHMIRMLPNGHVAKNKIYNYRFCSMILSLVKKRR